MVKDLQIKDKIPISLSCQTLEVSRSGFYDWRDRKSSLREESNQDLVSKIKYVFDKSRGTYGSPRVFQALKDDVVCSENRVARLMNRIGIKAVTHKKFKLHTTDSNHDLPIAKRVFETENAKKEVTSANQVWAGDITYVQTEEGWLFLAIYLDIFTRKVVGHATAEHMRTELVLSALEMAIKRQIGSDNTRVIAHTDRGSQYAAQEYREYLKEAEITASMSRKANCYDNAYAETFFKTLKTELVYQRKFKTREEARQAIFEYIEVFYNRERLHSGIGYQTPSAFEKQTLAS